jgi:tetratricopeptide (TPR) repeat protein
MVGGLNRQRAQTFRNGTTLLSFEELFTTEGAARAFRNPALRERFYAQAGRSSHYLTLGKRAGQLIDYQQALEKGLLPQEAFAATFKVSYTDLMLEMRAYLRQLTLPALVVDFPPQLTAATNPVE